MSYLNNNNIQNRAGCTVAFSTGTASKNGETLVVKNGDIDSHWYMQMVLSNGTSSAASEGDFYSGDLAQFSGKKRIPWVGQRCMSYWAPHMGINDAGVSISLLATPGREDEDRPGLLGGFDYNRIVLDFASSAGEGVELVAKTAEKYGFAETSMSYVIGDPEEVWLIEASGYHWAAKRYRDQVGAHANSYIIETDWDLCSADLEDYAFSKGWIGRGEQLNFREGYSGSGYLHKHQAPRPDIFSSIVRQNRADELMQKKAASGPVTVADMMEVSRDQLDEFVLPDGSRLAFNQTPWHSTSFYRDEFDGGEWLDDMPEEGFLRSPVFIRQICCDTAYEKTLGSAVFNSGSKDQPAGIMYGLVGVPTFSAYVPYFPGMKELHPAFSGIEAARLFEEIDLHAFGKYQEFHPIAEQVFSSFENEVLDSMSEDAAVAGNAQTTGARSFAFADKLMSLARQVLDKFWLYDLRIREWGRKRESAERAPDIYTIAGQVFCIGFTGGQVIRPVAVRKDGALFIDLEQGEEEAYLPVKAASEKYNFEWTDLPDTGDLFIYKNIS